MSLEYQNTTIVFTAGEHEYQVIFTGEHRNIEYLITKDGLVVHKGKRKFGHANKTQAINLLKAHLGL